MMGLLAFYKYRSGSCVEDKHSVLSMQQRGRGPEVEWPVKKLL